MTRPSESTRSGPSRAKGAVRFGRYVLVDRLGVGGMAEVFRALVLGPEEFQRVVVVKRILPTLSANPAFIKMFIDEAKVTGRHVASECHPGARVRPPRSSSTSSRWSTCTGAT